MAWLFAGAVLDVGVVEQTGKFVPRDVVLMDEAEKRVRLGEVLVRPTVLVPVYYRCPGLCSPLLNGIAEVVDRVDLVPGTDFDIFTISFDHTETAELARRKKEEYLRMLHRDIPGNAWRFFTADEESIHRLTSALGFRFQRVGSDFVHPSVVVILSEEGKIIRYLYGLTFLPFDLKMAVYEASEGKPGPALRRILRFCFSYDPEARRYVVNITRITGIILLSTVFTFFLVLAFLGRGGRRQGGMEDA